MSSTTTERTSPTGGGRWGWAIHGDGRTIRPGEVVRPGERLSWPRTIGIGAQHVVAMAGATILVPAITQFHPGTTLLFSGLGTMIFLLLTRNRLPSYLGSSFAFIAPVMAATAAEGQSAALGGILVTGLLLAVIGLIVWAFGAGWINRLLPPVVTGTIVALIGFNLAPVAWGLPQADGSFSGFRGGPVTALVTLAAIILATVLFRGMLGRLAILVGIVVGYLFAIPRGEVSFEKVEEAAVVGLPTLTAPTFHVALLGLFVPVVLVLVAENVGHVKSVATMTGEDLDPMMGRALLADGLATTLAGAGGGSGTTTYAENIGVMAATRVYSTAAYWVAAVVAVLLSLSPAFAEIVLAIPPGVLGGAGTLLYGMIGVLGARIWVQNKVDFSDPVNLTTAAVALIAGIANYTFNVGELRFEGIAIGTGAAVVVYHLMRALARWRGTSQEPASPASVPGGDEGQGRRSTATRKSESGV